MADTFCFTEAGLAHVRIGMAWSGVAGAVYSGMHLAMDAFRWQHQLARLGLKGLGRARRVEDRRGNTRARSF